ncbi:serine hydroxymethyltransferase [Aestuariispira ectoiniformans]|uniref:serine hydroxymethyltransferase n=1 Tax=Aestuariispira ectoiniformans TaxID=2775080 RepID=UPI00223B5134|nr:aminotransferase class I/II-fold pyridoxal phosphate-dependent enzyme [Aestuariispira ectoiniformans]
MAHLERRPWVPDHCEDYIQGIASSIEGADADGIEAKLLDLVADNRSIHDQDCINLNPATNVMNPKAEALLASGIGSRPSLGYPGDKYEMGLEAIEQIEVIAAELAAEVFDARFAEIRVASGAIANLYAFMACAKPGDSIIVPPADIGGHVTHQMAGAAGLYGLDIHEAPVNAAGYTVDLEGLGDLAARVRPKLITIGGSLNLFPHPIREICAIADSVEAKVLFDAAHMSGMIAGRAWQQPLKEGAHLMTMSTYKSFGGPASGLIVSDDEEIAERLDRIAFPGLTANFDAAKSAALAMALLDWKTFGEGYAKQMAENAKMLASALDQGGLPVFAMDRGATTSHQFAIEAAGFGGGQAMAKQLREANILACGIGLPLTPVAGDMNGLRLGVPEITRRGVTAAEIPLMASYLIRLLIDGEEPASVAKDVSAFAANHRDLHFIR